MHKKLLMTALTVFALVVAACGSATVVESDTAPQSSQDTASATPDSTEAPSTTEAASTSSTVLDDEGPKPPAADVEAVYVYAYEPGDIYEFAYVLDLNFDIETMIEGSPEFTSGASDEEVPEDVNADLRVAGTVLYVVADGPQPETVELTITNTVDELEVEGTFNGEPIAPEDLENDDMIPYPAEETVVVVLDEQGNVIEVDGEEVDVFGLMGGDALGAMDMNPLSTVQHLGPSFPDEEIGVGDTWGETSTEEVLDQTVTTEMTWEVVGTDSIGGAATAVIEHENSFSGVDIDLGELFVMFFSGLAELGEELGDESASEEIDEALEDFEFFIGIPPMSNSATIWFDPNAGLVLKRMDDLDAAFDLRFAGTDDTTGEFGRVEFAMEISGSSEFVLVQEAA